MKASAITTALPVSARLLGLLAGIGAGALWGLVFLAPVYLPDFSAEQLVLGRYAAYGVVAAGLMALAGLRGQMAELKLSWPMLGILLRQVLAGNLVYYFLLAYGVQYAGVPPTTLIIGLIPLLISVWGRHDHGAAQLKRLWAPLCLVVLGLGSLQWDVWHNPSLSRQAWWGMMCAAGALFCWAWYAVDNARFLQRHPHINSQTWANCYGVGTGLVTVLLLVGVSLWQGRAVLHSPWFDGAWREFWLISGGLALLASVLGNTLWNVAARRLPLTLSGQLIIFETLFALLYGFLAAQRWPRPWEYFATICLLGGVLWAIRLHRPPQAD